MTTRNDFSVEYNTSPRVAEIAAPSVEVVMQDVVDTLRKHEDSFQGMGFPKLVNASGKEDLGGGTSVGITVASQNTLLAFEARRTPAETGTVTGSPASPVAGRQIIQDTTALFQTANVARGSLVINFTDQSIADVISVDSETQLTTKTLVNGIGNTYDVTDVYQVFNVTQVKAVGGNLTAVDESQITIEPILPTAFTQVILTSSSSATLSSQTQLEASLFFDGIVVNATRGIASSEGLVGTHANPVINDFYAEEISNIRYVRKFYMEGVNILTEDHSDAEIFVGAGYLTSITVVNAGAIMTGATMLNQIITGTVDGNMTMINCVLVNLVGSTGIIKECGIDTGITPGAIGNNGKTSFTDVSAVRPIGGGSVFIDASTAGAIIDGDGMRGEWNLRNKTGSESFSFIFDTGKITIDATCTGGSVIISGDVQVIDNSGVGCTVTVTTTSNRVALEILGTEAYP